MGCGIPRLDPECTPARLRQMRLSVFVSALLLVQGVYGCASGTGSALFSLPSEEMARTIRTIAVAPVSPPAEVEVAESSLVNIEAMIEEMLVAAGYHCVSASEYGATWDRILAQMGGLYDSETGELDELRFEVAGEQLRRDLLEVHRSDHVLYPEIWIVDAEYSNGVAKWDGTSEPLVGFGTRLLNVIDAILNQYDGFLSDGVTNALSLGIIVEDMDGVEIFRNVGGIELLKDAQSDGSFGGPDQFEAVLQDPKRSRRAVRAALMPLVADRGGNGSRG